MTNRKPRRKKPSTALVHQSAADLVFKFGVQADLEHMSKVRREMPSVYRTPEYRVATENKLLTRLARYIEQMPSIVDPVLTEDREWRSPIVVEQNGELVMVRWRDRDDEMVEELVATQGWPTTPWEK